MRDQKPFSLYDAVETLDKTAKKRELTRSGTAFGALLKRRLIFVALLVLLLALAAGTMNGLRAAGRESYGLIASCQGSVQAWQNQGWQPAGVGQQVSSGTVVRTGPQSMAIIALPGGATLRMGPGAALRIGQCSFHRTSASRRQVLQLYAGRIWGHLLPFASHDSVFVLETPRGAVFPLDGSGAADPGSAGDAGQDTLFSAAVLRNEATGRLTDASVIVSVQFGSLAVEAGGVVRRTLLHSFQETWLQPGLAEAPRPRRMDANEARSWRGLDNAGAVSTPVADGQTLTNLEEQYLVRPLAMLASLVHLESATGDEEAGNLDAPGYDPDSTRNALRAGEDLRRALEASTEGPHGYPATIGLDTLSGVSLTQAQAARTLSCMAAGRLIVYHSTGTGYELYFRAKRPGEALIQVTPEGAQVLPDVESR